jgi:hypothetical protein
MQCDTAGGVDGCACAPATLRTRIPVRCDSSITDLNQSALAHISRVVKRAPIGWSHDDFDVLAEGEVVVHIMK